MKHQPVMLSECIDALVNNPDGCYIDGTIGGGGHCKEILNRLSQKGRVLGMDIVEITPSKDVNGITAITAGRFICNLIGSAVRAGYFKK